MSLAEGQWWLLDADVMEDRRVRIPKPWQADLYQGIRPNGDSFVLPVTFLMSGERPEWYGTLAAAAALARKRWVSVASDRTQGRFDVIEDKRRHEAPQWPDCEFTDFIERAFIDHTVLTVEDAIAKLQPRPRRHVIEEFDK